MKNQAINESRHEAQLRHEAAQKLIVMESIVAADLKSPFSFDDINMAVRDIYDMSEKTLINFIMLGDLARAIYDKKDYFMTDHLEFGFPSSALTPEIKSLFKTWNFEETAYGYKYFFTPPIRWSVKIPVRIKVYNRHYKFFSNPDQGFYGVDNFYIPNPFEKYWKARFIIQ